MDASAAAAHRPTTDRHAAVLNEIGTAICTGTYAPHTILSIDDLCARHEASRSVIREVLRVLASMGLVTSKRRVGTTTQPLDNWNLFDPQVIRWRLEAHDHFTQLRELAELRLGFEPEAAALAAAHVDEEAVGELMGIGARLWSAGRADDPDLFLRLDIAFHSTILRASGNPMYHQYAPIIDSLLHGRAELGLGVTRPAEPLLDLHMTIMRAIQVGDAERARTEARALIQDSLEETKRMWEVRRRT